MEEKLRDLSLATLVEISALTDKHVGKEVRVKGFVSAMRSTRSVVFVTIRDRLETVQAIIFKGKEFNEEQFSIGSLGVECYIECIGKIKEAKPLVFSCTKQSIELELTSLKVLGGITEQLPFSVKDASATEEERKMNESICAVSYNIRLDNRFLDLRVPHSLAIFKVISGVMTLFREYLTKRDFMEIKTTKIIQSGSEGGSNLFTLDFFGKKAFLAQSPQLYKQMAVIGGLKRVFEIGHVYRAEQSNINRYLSEFTGLDIEMELDGTYIDTVKFIHSLFVYIFDTLKSSYSKEIEIIRSYRHFEDIKYNQEPFIITHRECVDILKGLGHTIEYDADFNREQERILGAEVKKAQGVDLFVIIGYPACERAFYTYVDETGTTRSYDFILRGEEILSGAQRVTSYEKLKEAIAAKGIPVESMGHYLEPFKFGAPPHIGCGIGLERLMKSYFAFDDIRYFILFPRDPNRIYP